jgi:hypothetical protein
VRGATLVVAVVTNTLVTLGLIGALIRGYWVNVLILSVVLAVGLGVVGASWEAGRQKG